MSRIMHNINLGPDLKSVLSYQFDNKKGSGFERNSFRIRIHHTDCIIRVLKNIQPAKNAVKHTILQALKSERSNTHVSRW